MIGVTGENVFSAGDMVFSSGCDTDVVTEINGLEKAEPISVSVSDLALTGIVGATAGTCPSPVGLEGRADSALLSSTMVLSSRISLSTFNSALPPEFF